MVDEYYTVRELATKFKVTEQAIRNWIKAGKIASIKLGRAAHPSCGSRAPGARGDFRG